MITDEQKRIILSAYLGGFKKPPRYYNRYESGYMLKEHIIVGDFMIEVSALFDEKILSSKEETVEFMLIHLGHKKVLSHSLEQMPRYINHRFYADLAIIRLRLGI